MPMPFSVTQWKMNPRTPTHNAHSSVALSIFVSVLFYGVYFNILDVSYEDTAKYVCKALTTSGRDHANFMVYSEFAEMFCLWALEINNQVEIIQNGLLFKVNLSQIDFSSLILEFLHGLNRSKASTAESK